MSEVIHEVWACGYCNEMERVWFARHTVALADNPKDSSGWRHTGWTPWSETPVDESWLYCGSCNCIAPAGRTTLVHVE